MKLNLGCGADRRAGYVNIDINPNLNPDIVLDLEKELPFKNNEVEEIFASHVLEHVRNLIGLLEEMYRVSRVGAKWIISVPYKGGGLGNPFHVHNFFDEWTFRFFEAKPQHEHPRWGRIGKGTAHELTPVTLKEIRIEKDEWEITYFLEVVK